MIIFELLFILVFVKIVFLETANDIVPNYEGYFGFGMNPGYQGPNWNDETLSDITIGNPEEEQKGIGVNSLRLLLHEQFVEDWGYDVRSETFEHYGNLGATENTVFLQTPASGNEDSNVYCSSSGSSKLWRNMYEPIFDNGENGTPVNDNNLYALFVYKLVSEYGNRNVRYWEIINEPDYTSSSNGWLESGEPGSWWDNDPDPCDLPNLLCPIQHYVRLLRISYEVIKFLHPNQFICVGGIGYQSFLHAILRNTDNPTDGSITTEYPLKGGAYFDCLSFHNYPMYGLRTWNNSIGDFSYFRHSDAALDVFYSAKNKHQEVLADQGYDGSVFPKKRFICTETNVPSESHDNYIGSSEAQRNYVMKNIIKSEQQGIDHVHFYALSTSGTGSSYSYMGFYESLPDFSPYNQQVLPSGIGSLTTSMFTIGKKFDPVKTEQMAITGDIEGLAFSSNGEYTFALWAKTNVDMSEDRELEYTFPPASFNIKSLTIYKWDYSETGEFETQNSNVVNLYGYPIFVSIEFGESSNSNDVAGAIVGAVLGSVFFVVFLVIVVIVIIVLVVVLRKKKSGDNNENFTEMKQT